MGGTRDHRRQPHQHGTLAGRTASIRSSVRSSPSWDEQSKTRCLRLEESPLVQRISFSGSAILHRKVATTLWAHWYLAALGYAFRFLQNCQHCIEHKLGWATYTPGRSENTKAGSKRRTGRPPELVKSLSDVFWLLPGIYHAHAAGLCVFAGIICVATCRISWCWWPQYHCRIVTFGSIAFFVSLALVLMVNVHYVRKYRDETWQDPTAYDT